jgi:hypothetical protein
MADVVADLERLIRLALHQAVVILAGPHASTMYDWDSLITRTIDTTATVEADAPGPAPGGMTAALADRFVAQLTPAAVEVLALLCHNAPELTYEDLQAQAQAQLGISRAQVGGVLTSLAAGRKRLPEMWTTRSSATRSIAATGSSPSPLNCCCPLSTAPAVLGRPEDEARPMWSPAVRFDVGRAVREVGNPSGNPVAVTAPAWM